jgi:ATP-dependent DNA helicase RecQ
VTSLTQELNRYFGFTSFRPNQEEIVRQVLAGRDVFAALPTGGGKSLCYQLPALLREGLTVVVSPLISLMKDQVDAARENGIPAAFLNSALSSEESHDTWRGLSGGQVKLLYVSPERLSLPDFRRALGQFGLSLVAVDEAHCISEWGHEFRPDYRSLGLLRTEFPGVPIAAFTATATRKVQKDVVGLLGLRDPFAVRASFDRKEIFYRVILKEGDGDSQILEFVTAHTGQPGIVYRGTRKAVEKTAAFLSARGVSAVAYHAGLEDADRHARQDAFVRDEVTVVVATIAFGMGIDKSNVRWVVHGDLPRSVEGYYQETGRAARDGEAADTLLLYGPQDIAAIRWHIGKVESPEERGLAEGRLREILHYVESSACRRTLLLAHFDEHHPGDCGRCDVCAGEVAREDMSVAAQKVLSAAVRTGECFGAHHLADVVCGIRTDKVLECGHHTLPTFGTGQDHERGWWLSLIWELDAGGYLVRGAGRTAGFRLSARGRMVLHGKERFLAARTKDRVASAGLSRGAESYRSASEEVVSLNQPGQEELFRCLKALRMRLAREHDVPPYIIFSDKTLRALASNRPIDPAAFRRCPGVGDRKLEAYGGSFLKAIREFCRTGVCLGG